MSKEQKYTAIILKKQAFNESDEIITFYTKENGKIRALAKSVKSSKSKLQQKLQSLFLVNIILAGGKLPKIISVEPVEVFLNLRDNLQAMKTAFYAIELVLKSSADEEKNEPLFELILELFNFLNLNQDELIINAGLIKFKLEVLSVLGLAIQFPNTPAEKEIYFSPVRGGFFTDRTGDGVSLGPVFFNNFLKLSKTSFVDILNLGGIEDVNQVQDLLSNFINYQLERKMKSETYLKM